MAHGEITLATGDAASPGPRSVRLTVAEGPSRDRRLEDWITVNLDPDVERPATNLWAQIVGALPAARRPKAAGRDRGVKSRGGWDRFAVVYKRGATVVRVTDRELVQRADIDEWADDLRDLIEAGNHRIVLDFSRVERLGSWIVAAVVGAHRLCESHPGGRLKVCGMEPQLREIFRIIGMGRRIFMVDDEAAAVDGPWPESSPRALPVDILATLADALALPPIGGGAPTEEPRDEGGSGSAPAEVSTRDPDAEDAAGRIKHEVVQEVLIVTPVLADLEDEAANEALGGRLSELAERPLPRRVVIDLEFVGRLSRRTIGVILAHHLRLDRAGGSVRVCGAHPRVTALLDQVRFTMLVDCFPTLDEAVLAAWGARAER
ncbi:STAS domain-containing protein [Paludisphaera sp.]|uniref:STAS domain-containing protein n=1 Tax=Paludisphaera sp. TaxID=2017432 RepID=UPI00301D50CA